MLTVFENTDVIVKEVGMYEKRYKQGIHLKSPTKAEIREAIDQAYRDGFEVIYCHRRRRKPKARPTLELIQGGF